ncbi:sensor histidine kinase [Fulvimonas soli]|jgi:two-component system sensor histidine kinase AlgZ|uniref:Two-component system sensor histidine kinase AlgZ n=1 Tax=Fulvimonas soli TaxID=155197 RepID=A0A316IZ13_9GAMM|nr:histidine kinase [Fulvimonas soli]PWK92485.1 two-component system sensor histidine kinase AlgZ [Fulvimonas soli]TNY27156.1 sensor histidine kinase [Fulvimonas soli]
MPPAADRPTAEASPLPDFCSLPVLFALFVVGALTVTVMWLAPEGSRGWRGFTVGMAFVAWLALLLAVALCKLAPWLQRLPGRGPYAGVWLLMVAIVALASAVAQWMDGALQLQLVRGAGGFVRDNALIAALLGAAMLRYFYVLAQWQARLAAVAHAQVEALQARIRPHFLFNSMNTVAALVRMDPAAAERTVENLAELFRAALGEQGTRDGTLGEELALVERYLAIEQLRLGERLRVRRELDALPPDYPLPRLLLQPLVENAVRHGIQPLREGGEVVLRGAREGGALLIEIDNPLPAAPAAGGHGHGLDNVRRRVAYRYGAKAQVEAGPREGRFLVRLRLPAQGAGQGNGDARPDRR